MSTAIPGQAATVVWELTVLQLLSPQIMRRLDTVFATDPLAQFRHPRAELHHVRGSEKARHIGCKRVLFWKGDNSKIPVRESFVGSWFG